MYRIYFYNIMKCSSMGHVVLAAIFKCIITVSVFLFFFIVFNYKQISTDPYFLQAISIGIFMLFLSVKNNIGSVRYYNQVYIKRSSMFFYRMLQVFFSTSFLSALAIVFAYCTVQHVALPIVIQAALFFFVWAGIATGLNRKYTKYLNYILLILLSLVSIFYNPFILLFSHIFTVRIIIIVLLPICFYCINRSLYFEENMNVHLTFRNIFSEKKSILQLCLFEFLFLYRTKRKVFFLSALISIATLTIIFIDHSNKTTEYIQPTVSLINFVIFGFSFITGSFIILCGQFIFTWSLYYLNDLLLKKIAIKSLLIGKQLFMMVSALIIYLLTLPIVLTYHILPIEYTTAALFNIFILSILALSLSSFNISRIDMNISPSKYEEKGFIQSLVLIIFQRLFLTVYMLLQAFLTNIQILFFISSLCLVSLLLYPVILKKLEKAILQRRYRDVERR